MYKTINATIPYMEDEDIMITFIKRNGTINVVGMCTESLNEQVEVLASDFISKAVEATKDNEPTEYVEGKKMVARIFHVAQTDNGATFAAIGTEEGHKEDIPMILFNLETKSKDE